MTDIQKPTINQRRNYIIGKQLPEEFVPRSVGEGSASSASATHSRQQPRTSGVAGWST